MALRGATPCARTGQSSREVRGARACALGFEASERASAGGARRCGGGAAGAYERLRAHTGDAQRGRSVARRARGSTAAFAQGRKLIFRLLPLSSELSCAPQPCRGSLLRSTALQDQRRGHLHKSEVQHPPLCERNARNSRDARRHIIALGRPSRGPGSKYDKVVASGASGAVRAVELRTCS
jgi:hypothetical protein